MLISLNLDTNVFDLSKKDGGDITLLSIENEKIVRVQLEGTCVDCTVNQMTLKSGVEMTIKKYAPQIEKVINVS